jgi:hypothetical protein
VFLKDTIENSDKTERKRCNLYGRGGQPLEEVGHKYGQNILMGQKLAQ